jgi:hypothetical protein
MKPRFSLIHHLAFIITFLLLSVVQADDYIQVKALGNLAPYNLGAWDADTGDNFGHSVAISGDTIVIGSYQDNCFFGEDCGSVHVYVQNADTGIYEHKAKLTAEQESAYHYFGYSVSVSGDTILVGNYRYDPAGVSDGGMAYIFEKPLSGWSNMHETAILTSVDTESFDNFGISVAIDGDIAVVGNSRKSCTNGDNCGAVYIFQKTGVTWSDMTQTAKLTVLASQANNYFGGSVSINGNTVVVGAHGVGCSSGQYCGSAYVFNNIIAASGSVTEDATLIASDADAYDFFGVSVSISGNNIIVGASGDICSNGNNCGAAYMFNTTSLSVGENEESGKLTASDATAESFFGNAVSINDNLVLVGAPRSDCSAGNDCGASYLYSNPIGGWKDSNKESNKIVASDAAASDRFGSGVAIDNGYIVIGAENATVGSKTSAGDAYLYKAMSSSGFLPAIYNLIME